MIRFICTQKMIWNSKLHFETSYSMTHIRLKLAFTVASVKNTENKQQPRCRKKKPTPVWMPVDVAVLQTSSKICSSWTAGAVCADVTSFTLSDGCSGNLVLHVERICRRFGFLGMSIGDSKTSTQEIQKHWHWVLKDMNIADSKTQTEGLHIHAWQLVSQT